MSTGELLDLSTKREAAPARAWRNKYRITGNAELRRRSGGVWGKGEHWAPFTHPSREVAEQRAHDYIAGCTVEDGSNAADYLHWLGAFPCEGESPP